MEIILFFLIQNDNFTTHIYLYNTTTFFFEHNYESVKFTTTINGGHITITKGKPTGFDNYIHLG